MMYQKLEAKVALIAASKTLQSCIAEIFASQELKSVLNYSSDDESAEATAEII